MYNVSINNYITIENDELSYFITNLLKVKQIITKKNNFFTIKSHFPSAAQTLTVFVALVNVATILRVIQINRDVTN